MCSIIRINLNRSTEPSPLAFFVDFANKNSITESKEYFFNVFSEEQKPIEFEYYKTFYIYQSTSFPFTIDKINETVIREYEVEIDFDEKNQRPIYEWRATKYSFATELNKLLRSEFFKSKHILSIKLNSGEKKKNCELVNDLLLKINNAVNLLNKKGEFKNYSAVCTKPYYSLVNYLFSEFDEYTPDPKKHAYLRQLLASSVITNNIFKPIEISPEIFNKIIALKDHKNNSVFVFKQTPDLHQNFIFFLKGQLQLISSPIAFQGRKDAAYYLIGELCSLLGIAIHEIDKNALIKIGGVKLVADLCYTEHTRLNTRRPDLKSLIDEMILSSIKS